MSNASASPPSSLRAAPARRFAVGLVAALALAALATLYFALSARDGIISTNDGSHYALTKALAADRTARIDPYVNYAAIQPRRGTPTTGDYRDLSYRDGHYYSDRPPGTAFLAVPFYWLGQAVDAISGRLDLDFPLRYVTMLPPLLGAATALALALLARGLGAGWQAAVATAIVGALTTLLLKYATLLYSHITGAALVTGGLAALLLAERSRPRALLVLGGLLLGYSAVAEYPNLLLVVPVGLYLLWRGVRCAGHRRWYARVGTTLAPFALGWFLPVALLLAYNWLVFGRPWHTSYTYQYYFVWSRSVATTYILRPDYLLEGLRWLLVGPAGLLTVTPVFLLALWGLAILARQVPARALLILGVVLTLLLATAAHRTYKGGGSQDTRYLLSITPALLASLSIWFERVAWPPGRHLAVRLAWTIPVAACCAWGLLRSYLSLLAMFGHAAVERPPSRAWALLRANWRDPQIVAPGLPLLHYFVTLAVPLALACWLAWCGGWLTRRRARTEGEIPA